MSQQTWEKFYEKRNRFYITPHPLFQDFSQKLKAYKIHTVLDIGCGSGRHSIALAQDGYKVKGIDFSRKAIELAQKWAQKDDLKITFVIGDIHKNLPFPDDSFDAALAIDSIHYDTTESISITLSEVSRVLRKGGIFFITLPQKTANSFVSHLIFTEEEAKDLINKYFSIMNITGKDSEFISIWARNDKKNV